MIFFCRRLPKVFYYVKKAVLLKRQPGIIIACMPKSGSTFLTNALSDITHSRLITPTNGGPQDEQNLDYPTLVDLFGTRFVAHIHLKASDTNVQKIVDFGLKPVVLVRNLFDVVVSINDHLAREDTKAFNIYIDKNFLELTKAEQYDRIIDLVLPWYINFYVSWSSVKSIDPYWLNFEDLISDNQGSIEGILDYCGISQDPDKIGNAIANLPKNRTRFNRGVGGRGRKELSATQIDRILKLTKYYPETDFSRIL
ncbi:sulfotransferase domain-containing protein [Gammaproteobacteria bacterium]|nr:sulfotransferase domain-containing protein [Gammaproteobacteria bacterium]